MAEVRTKHKEKSAVPFRSGYVTIIGRPNVGKSTLLNQLIGEKVAIVSPRPQTTRNRVTGIRTTETSQIVLLDTPGIYQGHSLIHRRLSDTALQTLDEVDGALWLVDAHDKIKLEDERIAEILRGAETPVLTLLNKIDLVAKGKLLPLMERCAQLLPGKEIVPVSALKGEGVPILLEIVEKWLPEGEPFFTQGEYTDQTERFLVSEIVREKVFLLTRQEIPYGVAVTIDEFSEKEEKNLIVIAATIHTERDSHKGILIGKRGVMLKEIGRQAREELEKIFACRIFLELFVRVDANWTQKPNLLAEMGL